MRSVLVALALVAIAATDHPDTSANTNAELSSLKYMEKEFYRRSASADLRLKDAGRERLDIIHHLLDEAGDAVCKRELDRLSFQSAITDFDKLLVGAVFERLVNTGKVDRLECLLSANCPDFIASFPVEYLLAISKLPDAILVLPHAYSRSQTKASKEAVVRCLARAFPRLWESKESDASFVAECETWWAANRLACTVNYRYPYRPNSNLRDQQKPLKGLFLLPP